MKSYKITFNLNSAISMTERTTFDALLAYAFVKRKLGSKFAQKLSYTDNERVSLDKLPITRDEGGWFRASLMMFNKKNAREDTQRWRKRWANTDDKIADFGRTKRRAQVNKGEFKSYDMPIALTVINQVWFYFQSDDVEAVRELVSNYIYFIGKKRSQGFGEIKDFVIEETDFDFSQPYRPIPADRYTGTKDNTREAYCGWYPPYWEPKNMTVCVVPVL